MKRRYLKQSIWYFILLFFSFIVIAFVFGIIVYLIVKGGPAISWEFLTQKPRSGMREGGIMPAIVGTLYLVLGTLIFALPIGVFSAIYLNEYARKNRLTRIIRLSIVNMSGVPSVVFGLFGLGMFVIFFGFGKSILAGSLTLAFLILPVVITDLQACFTCPGCYKMADYYKDSPPPGASRGHYGFCYRHRKSCGRDCTDTFYRSSIHAAESAEFCVQPGDGTPISPFCYCNYNAGCSRGHSVGDGTGASYNSYDLCRCRGIDKDKGEDAEKKRIVRG